VNKGLIAATIFAFGFSAFFRKLAVDKIHPYNMQIISAIVYSSLIPLWYHLAPKGDSLYSMHGMLLALVTITLHICGSVAFGLLLKSSNSTGALAVMISCSPVITTLLSIYFLQEEFQLKHLLASLLILSGLILFNLK